MRRAHILKRNETCETVQQAIWFDTETRLENVAHDTIEHWLKFGWACYRKLNRHGNWSKPEWYRFDDIESFWTWVIDHVRDKTKLWMFCHNSNFDLPVMDTFRMLPKHGWHLKVAIVDGPPTVLQYRRDNCTIAIVDTLNIWRMPLAKIGEHVNLPKLEMPSQDASKEDWDTYGKRDVEVIMRACIDWWAWLVQHDMGGFACTLASQAFRTYRHKYMRNEIFIDSNAGALELARESFHGGRCECFFIGKQTGDFYLVDVNSMYPGVMQSSPMPIKLLSVTRHASTADLYIWMARYCVIVRARVNVPEPVLPYVVNNKLVFPTGRIDTVLTTPEVRWVLEHGQIEQIREVAIYESAVIFDEFVTDLYGRRMEAMKRGDATQVWQFKILMNSLYGKWAQHGGNWDKVSDTDDLTTSKWVDIDFDSQTVTKYRRFGGIIQRRNTNGESSNSHPAIASHITAYARMALWQVLSCARLSNCLYCDTDSALLTEQGYERIAHMVDPEKLGALKLDGRYNHVEIYGPKDYVFDTKVRIKGIRKKAVLVAPGTYEQERWSTLRGMMRDGNLERPLTRRIRKFLRRSYDKGVVNADGRVSPFHYF